MLASFISTRTYNAETPFSFSFILDERDWTYYILRGTISDLWNVTVSSCDYKKIYTYAESHNLIREASGFLYELKQKGFIKTDKNFPAPNQKVLTSFVKSKDKESYLHFIDMFRRFLYSRKYFKNLSLVLSYKCNLNCRHCFNYKDKDNYSITYETAEKIINEAYNLGISEVSITGGECSINKDFLKIAKYIRKKHLSLIFLTNAQRLYDDRDFLNEVINLYPSQIKISLYSMNPSVHDNITNVHGSHEKTLHVIQKLREHNINVYINCVQLSLNKNSYIEVNKFANSISCGCKFDCSFIDNKKNNNTYCKQDYEDMVDYYINFIRKNGIKPIFKKNEEFVCNEAGVMTLNITPELNITPCNSFKYILGNYNNITLENIWKNVIPEFHKKYRRINLKECFKYEYCKYCTYCPAHASWNSDFMRKSYAVCEQAKAYMEALKRLNK